MNSNANPLTVSIQHLRRPSFSFATAEHVGDGHPDKFCDQVADAVLDHCLAAAKTPAHKSATRTAIECLAKDRLLIVSGEVRSTAARESHLDVEAIAQGVWKRIGYPNPESLTVINFIKPQSPDIAAGVGGGVDFGGAGDQGVMVGYATNETAEFLPAEWVFARNLCLQIKTLRLNGTAPWLGPDMKTQVTVNSELVPISFIVAAQHQNCAMAGVSQQQMRELLFEEAILPILGVSVRKDYTKINGTGSFEIGGTIGDAGVVGRKIVVDQYGPRVPVGGGAFSGKDPSKVDRSAAYMARHIAKAVVANQVDGADECTVTLAYGIGQLQPEAVTAVTDSGVDVSGWVKATFPDLSPRAIVSYLGLADPVGWKYEETAAYGHFGTTTYPWEKIV